MPPTENVSKQAKKIMPEPMPKSSEAKFRTETIRKSSGKIWQEFINKFVSSYFMDDKEFSKIMYEIFGDRRIADFTGSKPFRILKKNKGRK